MEALELDNYTFKDYEEISQNDRCELIFGEIVMMASPNDAHQSIVLNIANEIKNFLKSKKSQCRVRISPYDIKLQNETSQSVVQPDVMLFCNDNIKNKINNIPIVVFEILSPSTAKYDMGSKKSLYESFGVEEYFLISPEYKNVQLFKLIDNKYQHGGLFLQDSEFVIESLDLTIKVNELFDDLLED